MKYDVCQTGILKTAAKVQTAALNFADFGCDGTLLPLPLARCIALSYVTQKKIFVRLR